MSQLTGAKALGPTNSRSNKQKNNRPEQEIYCDHNAYSPMRAAVIARLTEVNGEICGNPSAQHRAGRRSQALLQQAREGLAECLDCHWDEVVFVASGTEANNMIANTFGSELLIGGAEHDSLANAVPSPQHLAITGNGLLCNDTLRKRLATGRYKIFSCSGANNETGIMQPLSEIRAITRHANCLLHADLSQLCGKHAFSFRQSDLDYATVASHKLGGPVGIAALIVRQQLPLAAMLKGGKQELERRAGTEAVALAAAFAYAFRLAAATDFQTSRLQALRDRLEALLQKSRPALEIIGKGCDRLCNTSCWITPGINGQLLLAYFDQQGIFLSAGSACSSGYQEGSKVLRAMGFSDAYARTAIRASFGWNNTMQDVVAIATTFGQFLARRRA